MPLSSPADVALQGAHHGHHERAEPPRPCPCRERLDLLHGTRELARAPPSSVNSPAAPATAWITGTTTGSCARRVSLECGFLVSLLRSEMGGPARSAG